MGFLLAVYIYAVAIAIKGLEETGSSLTSTIMYSSLLQLILYFGNADVCAVQQ